MLLYHSKQKAVDHSQQFTGHHWGSETGCCPGMHSMTDSKARQCVEQGSAICGDNSMHPRLQHPALALGRIRVSAISATSSMAVMLTPTICAYLVIHWECHASLNRIQAHVGRFFNRNVALDLIAPAAPAAYPLHPCAPPRSHSA